ncbi:hypothetical protein GA0070606_1670 [Micromonospora citrea]|uniref:Uncharacterized protein n=1 Tax=Micromonospora citrea TaxID=47855 RepID=A0A1C6U9X4_9ACTN|nr:hypothetical protein [Micromonospora citrea]SCL50659.1 hypothetical protein GA0070606_1670 [Micromonospora citrea]
MTLDDDGGLLDPYKAKVLLRLLLAAGAGRAEIAAALARHGWRRGSLDCAGDRRATTAG